MVETPGGLGGYGSHLAVGYSTDDDSSRTGRLLEVGAEGELKAETTWSEPEASSVSAVEPAGNGAYVLAGFADEDGPEVENHEPMGRLVQTTGLDEEE